MNGFHHSFVTVATAWVYSNSKKYKQIVSCNTIFLNKIQYGYTLDVDVIEDSEKIIADSGWKGHFLGRNTWCTNIQQCAPGVTFRLPNNISMEGLYTALLEITYLPIAARQCHLFPNIGNKVLISITQFCYNGYRAIFSEHILLIKHKTNSTKSFGEYKYLRTRMWSINLT